MKTVKFTIKPAGRF